MAETRLKNMIWRWLLVCLLPAVTALFFILRPSADDSAHLIRGIILACECAFLLKFVLFEAVGHHLRGEAALKRATLWLLLPLLVLLLYICHYFGLF